MGRSVTVLYSTVDFMNIVHLGYTKFLKQHKVIKSSTREMDTTKRHSNHGMCEYVARMKWYRFTANFFYK